jgi:hypothetical protein
MAAVVAISMSWDPPFARALARRISVHFPQLLEGHRTGPELLVVGCSLLVAVFAAVGVHEVGHVVGGLGAGFRFHSLAIGPLKLDRRFRVSLHRGGLAWSGGWVGMFPVARDHLLLRTLVLVAAGPVSSLLCGCVLLVLPFSRGPASELFIASSLLGGMIELLPIRSRGVAFDGWRIWRLLRNRVWRDRSLALAALTADLLEGVPPEALSAGELAKAVALRDESIETVTAHAIAYSAAFHQRRHDEAGQMLETCLAYSSHAPPAMREALMSDAAVFQARRRGSGEAAQQWLAAMPAATGRPWLRLRVEAAILEARGEVEAASRKLDEYEAAILALALPSEAQRDMLLLSLRRWQAELRSARGGPPVCKV